MNGLFLVPAAFFLGVAVISSIGLGRDWSRIRKGRKFLSGKTDKQRSDAARGDFLGLYNEAELAGLQNERIAWVSKSIPDPRDRLIPLELARIYWRIALTRYESSQMLAEMFIIASSAGLGLTSTSFWNELVKSKFALTDASQPYLLATAALFTVAALSLSTKVASGRRWEEAIELYRRIGWPQSSQPDRVGWESFSLWPHRRRKVTTDSRE